jgi:hypothetical protein
MQFTHFFAIQLLRFVRFIYITEHDKFTVIIFYAVYSNSRSPHIPANIAKLRFHTPPLYRRIDVESVPVLLVLRLQTALHLFFSLSFKFCRMSFSATVWHCVMSSGLFVNHCAVT